MFQEEEAEEEDHFGLGVFNRARKFIWELFEEPNKSKLGKVVRGYISHNRRLGNPSNILQNFF